MADRDAGRTIETAGPAGASHGEAPDAIPVLDAFAASASTGEPAEVRR